jgi:hypothetical protein
MALNVTEGDTRPTRLTYTENDIPVPITGYSFVLKIGYSTPVVINCEIYDGPNGIISIPWGPGDLVKGGPFPMEMLVTDPGGKEKTHKLQAIQIKERII